MGDRLQQGKAQSFGRKPRRFRASFTLDAGNAPVISFPLTIAAAGFSRAEAVATGKYEFELVDKWPTAQLEAGATWGNGQDNVDLYPQTTVSFTAAGKPVITVKMKTGANNTNPPGTPNGGVLNVWWEVEQAP